MNNEPHSHNMLVRGTVEGIVFAAQPTVFACKTKVFDTIVHGSAPALEVLSYVIDGELESRSYP